jgi:O-antigen/teichoic acid export membrane protein
MCSDMSIFKPKSDFTRHIITLMTGTTIAQAIPIAISPLLTRLYTPEDFGILALFMSISTIFGSIANGRYELAIMLPEKDEDAFNIAALGIIIAGCISLVLLAIVLFFNMQITNLLNSDELEPWLYFIPFTVFLIGIFNVLNYFNNRMRYYKDLAKANVYRSLVLAVLQVGLALYKSGPLGLILGYFGSQFVANMKLLKNIVNKFDFKAIFSFYKLKQLAKRYADFPKYSLFAVLANTLAINLTNILISLVYSVSTLGFYSFVQRLLGMPTTIIGNAIGQVFFKEAVVERSKTGKAVYSFNFAIKKLTFIALPAFTLLFIIIEDIFAFVFGEDWRVAGEYGKILVPFFAVRFIAASLSNLNNVFEKQRVALLWQITLLVISLLTLFSGHYLAWPFDHYILIFSAVASLHYLFLLYILFLVSRGKL